MLMKWQRIEARVTHYLRLSNDLTGLTKVRLYD